MAINEFKGDKGIITYDDSDTTIKVFTKEFNLPRSRGEEGTDYNYHTK